VPKKEIPASTRPTVILLSFNSEHTLGTTLRRARLVSDEIFVVDSYSKDKTVELARSLGAIVVQHPFEHYGTQRNWAIDNLPITRFCRTRPSI
jgi:glycosyltransferase involved in cell wall biosynthesis